MRIESGRTSAARPAEKQSIYIYGINSYIKESTLLKTKLAKKKEKENYCSNFVYYIIQKENQTMSWIRNPELSDLEKIVKRGPHLSICVLILMVKLEQVTLSSRSSSSTRTASTSGSIPVIWTTFLCLSFLSSSVDVILFVKDLFLWKNDVIAARAPFP